MKYFIIIFYFFLLNVEVFSKSNPETYTPFMAACKNDNLEIMKLLFEYGADIYFEGIDGDFGESTAMEIAYYYKSKRCFEFLKNKGADLNPKYGRLIVEAANRGDLETVKSLHKKGAKFDEDVLSSVSISGDPIITKYVLDHLKLKNKMEIALYFAACEGRFSLVKYLIQKGADPNFKFKSYNEDFDTAKHSARSNGHRQVLELLEKEK